MNKLMLCVAITMLCHSGYTATKPAQAFSRANCEAYIPSFGWKLFNESVSYDAFKGKHYMGVVSKQKRQNNHKITRQADSGNHYGYRARAGFEDDRKSMVRWIVNGYHRETLDNGKKVYVNTVATGCNLAFDQFF